MEKQDFELYATKNTVVAVKGGVKRRILHLLQNKDLGFDDIVRATKKAKSTTSKHLQELESDGLISALQDPTDKRKKNYTLKGRLVGGNTRQAKTLDSKVLKDVAESIENPGKFINTLLRSIRYRFDSLGIDVAPMLYQLGLEIGEVISRGMKSEDLGELLTEISAFWTEQGLGELTVLDEDPPAMVVTNCYACSDMPNVGRTLCAFDEGIISSILTQKLGQALTVKEVECAGTGHSHCKFMLLPTPRG